MRKCGADEIAGLEQKVGNKQLHRKQIYLCKW